MAWDGREMWEGGIIVDLGRDLIQHLQLRHALRLSDLQVRLLNFDACVLARQQSCLLVTEA